MDGWAHSKRHPHTATDVATYQQDLVIHRTAGTDYEEVSETVEIGVVTYHQKTWHIYVGDKCRSDYGDLRFTDADGFELAYYLWPDYDAETARVTVRLEGTTRAGSLAVHFGNPSATTTSNGNTTFFLFDHFDGSTLDASKWTNVGNGATVGNGYVAMSGNGLRLLVSKTAFSFPFRVECRYWVDDSAAYAESYITIVQDPAGSDDDWVRHGYGNGVYYYQRRVDGTILTREMKERPAPSTWVDASIIWTKDSTVFSEDGEQVNTNTIQNRWSSGSNYVQFLTYWGKAYYDWVRVRAYSNTPPRIVGDRSSAGPILGSANVMVV